MKTQLLNIWHKIKDWLLVLPAFCFFDFFLECLILPRSVHSSYFVPTLVSCIFFDNKTLMTSFAIFLLLCSIVSVFTYKSWFLKYNAFILTVTWIGWGVYTIAAAYD